MFGGNLPRGNLNSAVRLSDAQSSGTSANRKFERRAQILSAGMVGHDFFKPYAVTFDFQNMQIFLQ
jgi:hypothetical protein